MSQVFVESEYLISKKKAQFFNSNFAAHCAVVSNTILLPDLQLRTNHRVNDFTINEEDIFAIIGNLNPNEAYA